MNPFETLVAELKRLQTGYREESFYRPLSEFLEEYADDREFLHMLGVKVTNNPASESVGDGVGFPDIEVKQNRRLIGYIEVKPPPQNLDNPAFSTQFNRYKESLENIVFTNFKKWVLYTWDKDGKPQKTAEATWDYENDLLAEELKKLLTVFFEGRSYEAKTPHQLALALARKTKLLSQLVEEALTSEDPDKRLVDLKKTFEKTLIQDIGDHQFANIYAETIAYSLFLAKLEHFEKGSSKDFTIRNAVDYLPKSVPLFKDLYQLTGGTVEPITPEIQNATEILIEQLNFADIERIYKKLVEHKPGEDPVIQFYEPFLSEYDPKEREARGVYYTPKPVVDYIVRSVDYILKTKFDKSEGLGDKRVQVLDPATGTGTFLMSVIQNIYSDIEKGNKPLGEEAIKRKFEDVVNNHILKHLYGFELLVAPYAIAHLKLTLELERLGFNFSMTENDQDKENDRLKIFLANTLDNPDKQPENLFGFDSITEESESARKVKKEEPIFIILGNPPYSGNSQNASEIIVKIKKGSKYTTSQGKTRTAYKDLNLKEKTFVGKLVQDYFNIEGVSLGERNPKWLQDDYVKFIRFAEWKIQKEGRGIVGMITNHGYIDNPTFRGMRYHLMKTFDEIYILNLHGNYLKKEKAPDGSKDESVFNIQVGTAICFFVKYDFPLKRKQIFFTEMWGTKTVKFRNLLEANFKDSNWKSISPQADSYLFTDSHLDSAYSDYKKITDVFSLNSIGFVTSKDEFLINFDRDQLIVKINFFIKEPNEGKIKNLFGLGQTVDWIKTHKSRFTKNDNWENEIFLSTYRPFDNRYVLYSDELIERSRKNVLQHMQKPNLALLCKRQSKQTFSYIFVSNLICESCVFESAYANNSVLPLYLYPEKDLAQGNLFDDKHRKTNLDLNIIKNFSRNLGLEFVESGHGDLEKTFGPEDVFYYSYAVFHSPTYRTRYADQLKIDFPRLPLTSNKDLFKKLIQEGNELVNLHLLGENPFDKSKTIFDDTSKWGVIIDGDKPENLDDWKVTEVRHDEKTKRVYVNSGQYFEGIEKKVWEFMIGGYQVLDKWLKDRKKAGRVLSPDDTTHYMKIVVSLRETIRVMLEIDKAIPAWPIA